MADKSDRSITDKIQKRIDEAQGSLQGHKKYVSFGGVSVPLSKINTEILQCKRGTPTWWVFPIDKSKLPNHPTECIDDLGKVYTRLREISLDLRKYLVFFPDRILDKTYERSWK